MGPDLFCHRAKGCEEFNWVHLSEQDRKKINGLPETGSEDLERWYENQFQTRVYISEKYATNTDCQEMKLINLISKS